MSGSAASAAASQPGRRPTCRRLRLRRIRAAATVRLRRACPTCMRSAPFDAGNSLQRCVIPYARRWWPRWVSRAHATTPGRSRQRAKDVRLTAAAGSAASAVTCSVGRALPRAGCGGRCCKEPLLLLAGRSGRPDAGLAAAAWHEFAHTYDRAIEFQVLTWRYVASVPGRRAAGCQAARTDCAHGVLQSGPSNRGVDGGSMIAMMRAHGGGELPLSEGRTSEVGIC